MVRDVEREWIAGEESPGCSWVWILLAIVILWALL